MKYKNQIAKMLGVEPGEKFKVRPNEYGEDHTFKIDDTGFVVFDSDNKIVTWSGETLLNLLHGSAEIVKLPWKPNRH